MFNKVKSFVNQHKTGVKYICTTAVVTGMTALAPVVAFAEEPGAAGSPDVRTQLKSSASSVAGDIMGTITDVLPIVLPIMGAMLVVGIGIAVVKKVTKKSSSG
jgi:hypothetical protein